jgi:hypothetical protein
MSTSRVIVTAKTPSLKASMRCVFHPVVGLISLIRGFPDSLISCWQTLVTCVVQHFLLEIGHISSYEVTWHRRGQALSLHASPAYRNRSAIVKCPTCEPGSSGRHSTSALR